MHHESMQRGSLHSAAGPASPEVEEQRCARCCRVREHGPDALVAIGSMTWIRRVRARENGNCGDGRCTTAAATLASATTGRSLRRNPTANCSVTSCMS